MFYNFLWDGKGDKIKRSIMISDYENGGLRVLDLNSLNKALKLSWVRKYLNDNNSRKWKLLFDFQLEDYGGVEFFRGNLDRKDVSKYINVPDPFIAEIFQIWTELSFEDTVKSMEHLLSFNLWHNSLVKVGKKRIYYKSWSAKGTKNVRYLMRDESKFLSFTEFKERFDIKTNFLTFYGVISSIKNLRNKVKTQPPPKGNYESFIDVFLSVTKTNRMVYQKCVSFKQTSPSKTQNKWLTDCQITCSDTINWKVVYKLPFSCTKISKLILFQFKLLHRRLAANDILNKIGIRPDGLWTFCKDERESLIHLFWSCRETNFFWKNFQDWLNKNVISLKHNSTLSSAAVLGLKPISFLT